MPHEKLLEGRTLTAFYSRFTAGARPDSYSSPLIKDGKYMFSIANNNFFDVRFDFEPWLGAKLPKWVNPVGNDLGQFITKEYIDNLTFLIQGISMPGVGTQGVAEEINNDFGKAMIPPKGAVITASNELEMTFLNTEYSVFEYMLLPWLQEVQSNIWVYPKVPFARADINVNFMNQLNKNILHTYTYHDCYPLGFDTLDLSQEATTDITRGAVFSFDYMTVKREETDFLTVKSRTNRENSRISIFGRPKELFDGAGPFELGSGQPVIRPFRF
jgi:hypothetical protein